MAIYSAVPPPPEFTNRTAPPPAEEPPLPAVTAPVDVDIDAWTLSALQSLRVSPVARGTGKPLVIPLDDHLALPTPRRPAGPPRPPSRRDSQRRREALLHGKEGSRQRRRWENDRLIGVPNAQPPLPTDWEVRPTHPVHRVPYHLAHFWELGLRQRVDDDVAHQQAARKKHQRRAGCATGLAAGEVPRDLRETAKRSPATRRWLRALEEPVRAFLVDEQRRRGLHRHHDGDESDGSALASDEEEIVFPGRSGAVRQLRAKQAAIRRQEQSALRSADAGICFDSFGDDDTASFKRWLTHAISDYYGLASRTVSLAGSAGRVVYVGLKQTSQRHAMPPPLLLDMPRPLWEIC